MDLIDGIGGAFLFSNNPKRLAEWYGANLGIGYSESPDCSSIYKSFEYRDLVDASVKRSTTWAILRSDHDINGKPRTGQINYRSRAWRRPWLIYGRRAWRSIRQKTANTGNSRG